MLWFSRMLGLSILPVPATAKPAEHSPRQKLHHQSLSIIAVTRPAQMNTAEYRQEIELHHDTHQIFPSRDIASIKTREPVRTFVCVFCQGVTSLVIGEFLEFQVNKL